MESLDRTKLYDELLRRFIRRELRKGPRGQEHSYEEATPKEQDAMVDEEMKKLGISALGMFVREKLSLKVGELEDDLKYMRAKATDYDSRNKKMLKSAETVFGSFFFIHDSRTENEAEEKEAAFEFLHKTFYEFLVADLILQYLIDAADDLSERKRSPTRGETHYLEALENPDSLNDAYYATINSSCLCREPEIIRMIAEWKDSKLNKFFQGKCPNFSDEIAPVLSDLLDKHTDMIRNGVFAPFVQRKGGLAGGRDYLQACAVYLMNLIVLQILIAGECHVKVEEWNYISQFLKLNLPLPQKDSAREFSDGDSAQKLKIDPYEEIILKFMNLFLLERKNDDIVLTKKTLVGKQERANLQEARMDIFNFMQDDTTRKVYQLHDLERSLRQKQQDRLELRDRGFDFGFEKIVAQLHEDVLLRQESINSLEKAFRDGVRYLHQKCVDESLVLDWLLLIRLIIDNLEQQYLKKYNIHRVLGNSSIRDMWKEIIDIIFRRFMIENDICLISLEITKKLGYGNYPLQIHLTEDVLNHYVYTSPGLITRFAEAILETHFPLYEVDIYHLEQCKEWLENMTSPKAIAAVLNLIYTVGILPPNSHILRHIREKWNYYLKTSPEELPALLRVYLQLGQFQEVKEFFQNIENDDLDCIIKLFDRWSESGTEFLCVAQTVGENRNLIRHIILRLDKDSAIELTIWRNPNILMQFVHQAIRYNASHRSTDYLINSFIERYEAMFHCDPDQAIYLLSQISMKQISVRTLSRECVYSLQHFRFILETSVRAAARLLTLCEKLNTKPEFKKEARILNEHMSLSFYSMLCFNKALITRERTNIYPLEELLNNLTQVTAADLEKYFRKQFSFLEAYSFKLAEKVRTMYGMD